MCGYDNLCLLYHVIYFINYKSYCFCSRLFYPILLCRFKGKAEINLPDWFGILNKDFRYQLTAIGAPGPNLYIAEEIPDTTTDYSTSSSNNNNNSSRFKIAGGASGMKVSWQVTGIRRILGLMLTGFRLRKINLIRNKAIIYIQIFMVRQKRRE